MNYNAKLLKSFSTYCNLHPEQRFYQALTNWSGFNFVYFSLKNVAQETQNNDLIDTYYMDEIFYSKEE
jgi:hypothetical protein